MPLIAARFDIEDLRFAPDGALLAFVSSDSERAEVYVAHRNAPHRRVRVSDGGGRSPRWGRSGAELFYLSSDDRLMSSTISTHLTLAASLAPALHDIGIAVGGLRRRAGRQVCRHRPRSDGERAAADRPTQLAARQRSLSDIGGQSRTASAVVRSWTPSTVFADTR